MRVVFYLLLLAGCSRSFDKLFELADVPPAALSYRDNPVRYVRNAAIAPNQPSWGAARANIFRVDPPCPQGLVMSGERESIHAGPLSPGTATDYAATATSDLGATTVALTIEV